MVHAHGSGIERHTVGGPAWRSSSRVRALGVESESLGLHHSARHQRRDSQLLSRVPETVESVRLSRPLAVRIAGINPADV